MKRLRLILHSTETTAGTTVEWCESRSINYEVVASPVAFKNGITLDSSSSIVFGGDMEAWETEKNPWLMHEKAYLKQTVAAGERLMGICLGSQLVAETLGGEVGPMGYWQMGWYPVNRESVSAAVTPFHCHKSTFSLPPDARVTYDDRNQIIQGFRCGSHRAYQFHTEIDETRLKMVLEKYKVNFVGEIQTKEGIQAGFTAYGASLKEWFFRELDEWWF